MIHSLPFSDVLFLLTPGISSVPSLHVGPVDGVTQFTLENDAISSFTSSASAPELHQVESGDGKVYFLLVQGGTKITVSLLFMFFHFYVRNLDLLHSDYLRQLLVSVVWEVASLNLLSAQGMHWINTRLLHRRLQFLLFFTNFSIFPLHVLFYLSAVSVSC